MPKTRNTGAGCLVVIIAAAGVAFVLSQRAATPPSAPAPAEPSPFKFHSSKIDPTNPDSIMELYTGARVFDPNTLSNLCIERRNVPQNTFFLVVFDSAETAQFPSNPFSAFYGLEANALRHIIAAYTYNRGNGFSELNIYRANALESPSTTLHP